MTVDRNSATYRFAKSSTIATLKGIDAASASVASFASDVVDFTDNAIAGIGDGYAEFSELTVAQQRIVKLEHAVREAQRRPRAPKLAAA
jgi:hypothetical protein